MTLISPSPTTETLQNDSDSVWPLNRLFRLSRQLCGTTQFLVASKPRNDRYFVSDYAALFGEASESTWFAQPLEAMEDFLGDNPRQLHPRYVMAVLSSWNAGKPFRLRDFPIPAIRFSTPESVRRSMTLNSMRMSLEYFESGSFRVLEMVGNRLAENQRDVVHDLCVYLMRHLLDIREREREARFLRAESVAAFLGLNEKNVQQLFLARRLSAAFIVQKLEEGHAGTIRRSLNVEELVGAQIALLRPQLQQFAQEESRLFVVLDDVVARLRA